MWLIKNDKFQLADLIYVAKWHIAFNDGEWSHGREVVGPAPMGGGVPPDPPPPVDPPLYTYIYMTE